MIINLLDQSLLEALCIGAAFLGSGGGGNTDSLLPYVTELIKTHGAIQLIAKEKINDGLILGIEFIGAPVPTTQKSKKQNLERSLSPNLLPLFKLANNDLNQKIVALMPIEIGGMNALTPMLLSTLLNLPLIDGDLLGRAFPEIPMVSLSLFNKIPHKTYISYPDGSEPEVLITSSYAELEQKARAKAMLNINNAAVMISAILTRMDLEVIIPNTISKAVQIGMILKNNDMEKLLKLVNSTYLGSGQVTHVKLKIMAGFLKGEIEIRNQNIWKIYVKNEYLRLEMDGGIICQCPDIITLLDKKTNRPIQSDQIYEGQEVILISAKSDPMWYTEKGLKLVNYNNEE